MLERTDFGKMSKKNGTTTPLHAAYKVNKYYFKFFLRENGANVLPTVHVHFLLPSGDYIFITNFTIMYIFKSWKICLIIAWNKIIGFSYRKPDFGWLSANFTGNIYVQQTINCHKLKCEFLSLIKFFVNVFSQLRYWIFLIKSNSQSHFFCVIPIRIARDGLVGMWRHGKLPAEAGLT